MKPATCLLCLCALLLCGKGQAQKEDYNWVMGVYPVQFQFSETGYTVDSTTFPYHSVFFNTSFTANTADGEFLFYTNGAAIYDRNGDTLPNGTGLNPSTYVTNLSASGTGNGLLQGATVIKQPNSQGTYYIFHHTADDNGTDNRPTKLYYTKVVFANQLDLGTVIAKNTIYDNVVSFGNAYGACRHGNGRDWWLIAKGYLNRKYYTYLFSPAGLASSDIQEIGDSTSYDTYGNFIFVPSGAKMIYCSAFSNVQVFDFDRCSGELSNPISFPVANDIFGGVTSLALCAAISANGRMLYISSMNKILQYDLEAPDILASEYLVFKYTGPDSTNAMKHFLQMQLAPDGKIYVNPYDGYTYLSVIDSPDVIGSGCSFHPHSIYIPFEVTHGFAGMPMFPNFRLGAELGSGCDTVVAIDDIEKEQQLRIFPNPAHDFVVLDYGFTDWSKGAVMLDITNEQGQSVLQQSLPMYSGLQRTDVRGFATGLYHVSILRQGKVVAEGRFGKL